MKRKLISVLTAGIMTAVFLCGSVYAEESKIVAFPGAQGGGMYTTGGRGCEVYIVDTLEDYDPDTEEPIKGSFRDAVSGDNRMIVFNVGGVIELKNKLNITDRKNLTIAGQTAPGNGITIYGYETNLSRSENIIIRYIRFRAGAKNVHQGDSMDAIWGRSMKNIMIDHISTSWSTDETMSLYRAENMTVQWSMIAESLTMSGHTKGRHGYGAIWGGVNTTYHHNLIANHTSRNPRFGGGTVEADDNEHIAQFDVRNNVIYNWGYNTAYGGGRGKVNFVYNYEKPGNGTRESVISRVIDCGEKDKPGWFYVYGNVIEGNEEVTNDNSKGIYISEAAKKSTVISDVPFEVEGTESITTDTPQEAYNKVLAQCGATYPKRDALDSRIVNEVRENKGRFANRDEEVGGLPYNDEVHRDEGFDRDCDGIPDEWEEANGLDPNDPKDSSGYTGDGYTYIEKYINSLVDVNYAPQNPYISLEAPHNNAVVNKGEDIKISVNAKSEAGIERVDFYNGDNVIGTAYNAPYEMILKGLEDGSYYISAKAVDKNGLETQATASAVHINSTEGSGEWISSDIGAPKIKGTASLNEDVMTVKGAGKFESNIDTGHFVYKELEGSGSITVKVDSMTPVDNHAFAGIMIRESMAQNSVTVAAGISHTKPYSWKEKDEQTGKETTYYRNAFSTYMVSRRNTGGNINDMDENLDSPESAQKSGVQLINDIAFKDLDEFLGYYLKLERSGDLFVSYISPDGNEWTKLGEMKVKMKDKVLIGMAVDGNKVDNNLNNLNTVKFSNIEVKGNIK